MTHEQAALWQKIRDFPIDVPNASYPYSTRLAREQGWTPVFTARVIEEYRRFSFLAVVSDEGATPSKAVDEAWHLHLLYTRNYWEGFCANVLGRPLHHQPADGNEADDRKYEGWYEATLARYERFFGTPPPEDVWPRRSAPVRKRPWGWLAPLGFLLAGCDEPLNPLDWHGPPFLQLVGGLYLVALVVAWGLREALNGTREGPPAEDWRLHVYEEAYLNEGAELALATALARLYARGEIVLDRKKGLLQAALGAKGDHPLDRAILQAAAQGSGADYDRIQNAAAPILAEVEGSLRRQGLWVTWKPILLVPASIAFLPVLLGLAKIAVGLSRERPVGFLILGCGLATVLNLWLMRSPKRSRYGDRVLGELQARKGDARYAGSRPGFPADQLATGIALFGVAVLANGPYMDLRRAIQPASTGGSGSDGGGSSCGSSCGSSGCGGGGCGGCGSS